MKWILGLLLACLPLSSQAATLFPEEKTLVNSDTHESQFLMDETIAIQKPVQGDVFCMGLTVTIEAPIYGDIICAAKTITINAPVSGDIRILALDTIISASIAQRATIISSELSLTKSTHLQSEWFVWAKKIEADIFPDQQNFIQLKPLFGLKKIQSTPEYLGTQARRYLISIASALFFALIASFLLPHRIETAYKHLATRKYGALLWGAWLAIGIPVLSLLFIFTIIGIPIGFALIALWLALVYSAQLLAGGLLGYLLVKERGFSTKRLQFLAPCIGIPLLWIFFSLPIMGWLFRLPAICIGFAGMWYGAESLIKKNIKL